MRLKLLVVLCFLTIVLGSCSSNDKNMEIATLDDLANQEFIIESNQVADLEKIFDGKIVVYEIRYESDECEVVGYVGAPSDYLEKDYPVLVYNRGGNREFGKLDPITVGIFAMGDYIVLASQYRGVDGGTGTEQFGGDEIN